MEEIALRRAIQVTKEAYARAKRHKNVVEGVQGKEGRDIVSEVDKFMERELVKGLKRFYPNHTFIGEEFGTQNQHGGEYEWKIDPIDGTINFVAGLPLFSTTLALRRKKETVMGVVFDWTNKDIYWAIKGKGAFRNRKKLQVSNETDIKNAVVTVNLTSHYNEKHTKDTLEIISRLASKTRGVRVVVSGAIELAWLASGKTDAKIKVKPSDGIGCTAGRLLVTEAGGCVTSLQGEALQPVDNHLASNGKIHEQVSKLLKGIV